MPTAGEHRLYYSSLSLCGTQWMVGSCVSPTPATTVATTAEPIPLTSQAQEEDLLKPEWPNCPRRLMCQKTTLSQLQDKQQSCSFLHLTLNYIVIESKSQRLGEYIGWRKMRVPLAFC